MRVDSLASEWCVILDQESLDYVGGMSGCIVVVKLSILRCLHVRPLSMHSIMKAMYNLQIVFLIGWLALLYFFMNQRNRSTLSSHCCKLVLQFWALVMTDAFIGKTGTWFSSRNHKDLTSLPMMMVFMKSRSWLLLSSMSGAISMQSCFSCLASTLKTNFSDTLHMHKSSVKMQFTDPVLILTSWKYLLECYTTVFHDFSPNLLNKLLVSVCELSTWACLTLYWGASMFEVIAWLLDLSFARDIIVKELLNLPDY